MSKPCREKTITYCIQDFCQEVTLKYYGDNLCEDGKMCDWKHWLVQGENIEWDYYDEEYCLRKLGLVNRERDDIGF